MLKIINLLVILLICFVCLSDVTFAGSATVSWQANTEQDLKGYNVYAGTTSRNYGTPLYIDKAQTSYTFNNLNEGTTYYFCITALDITGNESGFSQEVYKMIEDLSTPSIPVGVTVQ